MEDIFVGRIMSSPVATTQPETPIQEAAQTMLDQSINSLIIVGEDGHPEGILTSTDLVHVVADQTPIDDSRVEEYMNQVDTVTTANTSIQEAADTMMARGTHHLPVVEDEAGLIGILTTTDLTAYLSDNWAPSPS
ncbi:CBS domain protein [Natronomonas pharaonis DSM 2160]|uniref:CBS domain protein n=1 Tax=Natronomonas pharaonis (strain ATCC 35678 / DSM 2160 / CIP 103997 / JCM 8858 / NBRC 14720 / NCIMB 2260 / Gabara) TaxID=348780 RepID=A0A1U7EYQ7_NATPD|nr:CBS domain-containing protein [Natronomonas pharaonis]CAI50365.2 CBS domain protein [Natronomonas pharaonis DSM 2160]